MLREMARRGPAPSRIYPGWDRGPGSRNRFAEFETGPVRATSEQPVSTFSIDVDTVSYSWVRSSLNGGALPRPDSVRIEEMINYFPYDYPKPEDAGTPFATTVSVLATPWNAGTKLLHVGIKGYELAAEEPPRANLVFLIDTSGSMRQPGKLPLLVNALKLLLDTLDADDTVGIVTYAGSAGVALEPVRVAERSKILAALEQLRARGSTDGGEGIRQAYLLAEREFDSDGINRVILATDGDFNVGITDPRELKGFVERKRAGGVFLSVLGFGRGNYNDALMQELAQNGNGNAAYIDSLLEARKVLVDEAKSTLFPIAKDVKIQIEFNPAVVSEYRLIGYESRMLRREDFQNDKVDAGDVGSGHTVTALYEITPAGSGAERLPDLRYRPDARPAGTHSGEYAFVSIRFKRPDSDESELITRAVTQDDEAMEDGAIAREARFAAAVAAFGQILRDGRYTGDFDYNDVIGLAQASKGDDVFGYRSEFVNLVRLAASVKTLSALEGK